MSNLKYRNDGKIDWSDYNTLEDFQKFIDDNNIKHASNLVSSYKGLYARAKRYGFVKLLKFKAKSNNWKSLNTIDDIQKFIDDNDIKNPSYIYLHYSGLFSRMKKLNIKVSDLKFKSRFNNWSSFNTLEDFQKFIDDNNIIRRIKFYEKFPGLYKRAEKLKLIDKLRYKISTNNWSSFNTLEDFQKFIDDNDVKSSSMLKQNYGYLYKKICSLGLAQELIYEYSNKSYMETKFDTIFPVDKYPMIKRNSTDLEWLITSKGSKMRPDILINTKNIKLVIEAQGYQHFYIEGGTCWGVNITEKDFQEAVKRDELKYKLLTEHGYTVIYFVDTSYYPQIPKKVPEKFEPGGYIGGTTIMTSWNELIDLVNEKLKEIEKNA